MILTLSGANFAQNNIGKIDIPTTAITSIAISGSASVTGETSNYTCTATYEDNTTRDVTSLANWSVNNSYATISSGVLTIAESATTAQSVTITATYSGKTATKSVSVKYQDISDATSALLTAYGNKTLTTTQRKAVDAFYTTLNSASYKSKIKNLFIPIIANDLSHSLIDVMSDTFASHATLTSACHELTDRGLKNIQTSNGTEKILLGSTTIMQNNFHYLFAYKMSDIETAYSMARPMNWDASIMFGCSLDNTSQYVYDFPNSKLKSVKFNVLTGVSVGNSVGNIQYWGVADNKIRCGATSYSIVQDTNDYASQLATVSTNTTFLEGYQVKAMSAPHALISFGEGLTDAEYTSYYNAVNALCQAFGLNG